MPRIVAVYGVAGGAMPVTPGAVGEVVHHRGDLLRPVPSQCQMRHSVRLRRNPLIILNRIVHDVR